MMRCTNYGIGFRDPLFVTHICGAKICQDQYTVFIGENACGFEVTVQNVVGSHGK